MLRHSRRTEKTELMRFLEHWPFKKKEKCACASRPAVIALCFAVISLAMSFAMVRWCLIILDEQIKLRNDVSRMENEIQMTRERDGVTQKRSDDPHAKSDGSSVKIAPPPASGTPAPTAPIAPKPATPAPPTQLPIAPISAKK
jgi:hypothetical protein